MLSRPLLRATIAAALGAASLPAAAQPAPSAPPAPHGQPMPPPAYWVYAPPALERRSVGAMVAGIVTVSLGGVGLLAGTSAAISARSVCGSSGCIKQDTPGIALGVAGAVLLGAGIPTLVYGARRVPVKAARRGSARRGS